MRETMWRQPDDLRRSWAIPARPSAPPSASRVGASCSAAPARAGTRSTTAPRCCATRASRRGRCRPTSRRSTARRPASGDALLLLSHRGTKHYTSEALARAQAAGAETVQISAIGAPGADIETCIPETSPAFTSSHLCAMLRVAQIARALGADLGPRRAAGRRRRRARRRRPRRPAPGPPAAVRRQRHERLDRRGGRAQDPRDGLRRGRRLLDGVPAARPERRRRRRGRARRARRRRPGDGAARADRRRLRRPRGAGCTASAATRSASRSRSSRSRPSCSASRSRAPSAWGRTRTRSARICPAGPRSGRPFRFSF